MGSNKKEYPQIPESVKLMIRNNVIIEKKKRNRELLNKTWSATKTITLSIIGFIGFSIMAFLAFMAIDDNTRTMIISWFTF